MRLKRSSKNAGRPVLRISLAIFIATFLCGCGGPIEPTYKEENIPSLVKQICKDEYHLEVITKRTPTTLWIYVPLAKILHKDYGRGEDKIFDDEMTDKLRNILNTMGRVLTSSDKAPEFFALLASDINLGLDYTIIGNTLDIKKSYAGFIPWTEANRRYILELKAAPEAIGDTTAKHLQAHDIRLADFLAEQISQRIVMQFQEEGLKKYFKVGKSEGRFSNGDFIFEYSIEQIATPEKKIRILKEIFDTISYCITTYNFKDFSSVEIKDLVSGDKLILNKEEVLRGSIL